MAISNPFPEIAGLLCILNFQKPLTGYFIAARETDPTMTVPRQYYVTKLL